jgi:hypothetical protein
VTDRREILQTGADILATLLIPHGFRFGITASGNSSGGAFARGEFVHADRKLELHFRFSLGLVTYHIGQLTLAHDDYMRALLGRSGASHYPGFSENPMAGFEQLRLDLVEHASDFVKGTGAEFLQCVERNRRYQSLSGFQKIDTGFV